MKTLTKKLLFGLPLFITGLFFSSSVAFAEEAASKIDTGDTAWMLISSALVMLMVPGLAIFYGGLSRRKNVLNSIMMSFVALGVITIQWILFGYSLAFGDDIGGFIGNLKFFALAGVDLAPSGFADTIPHQAFMVFQMMFAIITPALISGAIAERMKFSTYIVFILLWSTLVYDPLCHWVWGGGWIGTLGALDYAGGLVVHISSGVAGLACALVLGKRKGFPKEPMTPHNVTMVVLGAAMLWFGWFGFNAGSALASGAGATGAFVTTQIATGAALLGWVLAEWAHGGKPTVVGAASGAVAGLVAITPAAGWVGPISSIAIGGAAGVICYIAVVAKSRFGYDDSLDAFGIHGIGGTWGAIATGLFAVAAVGGVDGLFFGNPGQLMKQIISIGATWAYSFVVTFIILKVLDATMGLRVTEEEEEQGLDISQHGESGYSF
jgi:Amt family ammonium transporter